MIAKMLVGGRWRRFSHGVLGVLLGLSLALSGSQPLRAQSPSLYDSPIKRFGFGVAWGWRSLPYDVTPLHAGWYVNWSTSLNWSSLQYKYTQLGLEFVQMVNVYPTVISPSVSDIMKVARTRPGSLWLIGNEPDSIYQNNVLPEKYAMWYHTVYVALKQADPTCKVAIAGVVEVTDLRLQYLERVLSAYQAGYGHPMTDDIDVWNVHVFVLPEKRGAGGAEIPPGFPDVTQGATYRLSDHDNMTYFAEQVVRFRQWMADKGERDKALIVSEYGILLHDIYGFDYARVSKFMLATFDYFMTATDPTIGYPADGNRLVQRWCWYSLDDTIFGHPEWTLMSALYNPSAPYGIRQLGRDFGAYTSFLLTPTATPTVPLATETPTATPTPTMTSTATETAQPLTGTPTPTGTATAGVTLTWTPTPSAEPPTGTLTVTATPPITGTVTPTVTSTRVITDTPTATVVMLRWNLPLVLK